MPTSEVSTDVRDRALSAIRELDHIISDIRGRCDSEDFSKIVRAVGASVGHIHMNLLQPIYTIFPELDLDKQ